MQSNENSPEINNIIHSLIEKHCHGIFYNTDLSLDQIMTRNNAILKKAMTLDELIARTSEKSVKNVKGCVSRMKKADPNIGRFLFSVRCGGTRSKGPYDVRFRFKDAKIFAEPSKNHVQVSCNCGAWKYNGADYNSITKGYNERQFSTGAPPRVRDQNRRYLICKHIAACVPVFTKFLALRLRDIERYKSKPSGLLSAPPARTPTTPPGRTPLIRPTTPTRAPTPTRVITPPKTVPTPSKNPHSFMPKMNPPKQVEQKIMPKQRAPLRPQQLRPPTRNR